MCGCQGLHRWNNGPTALCRGDVSQEDLQFAADLAAYFSKARQDGKVSVILADPKHISKPRGAPLGLVSVSKEKTLVGRPGFSVAAK